MVEWNKNKLYTASSGYGSLDPKCREKVILTFVKVLKLMRLGYLPDEYLIVDFETTGLDSKKDRIIQAALCAVTERKFQPSWVYFKHPGLVTEEVTKITGITPELLEREGKDPNKAFPPIIDYIKSYMHEKLPIIGHNFANFDVEFLWEEADRCGKSVDIEAVDILDTGLIVKGGQFNSYPEKNLEKFYIYMGRRPMRIRWSLDYCIEWLKLPVTRQEHNAVDDCYITWLLLETLRNECMKGMPYGEHVYCRRRRRV